LGCHTKCQDSRLGSTARLLHLCRLGLDGRVPDHSTFSKNRHGRFRQSDALRPTSPSLLLLDEPLAGMSPRERVETVALLKSVARGRTMIIIDHDMDSLFEVVERVTVLQEGRVLAEGAPDEIRTNPKVQEAYLGGFQGVAA
jgi:ABC-type branched-subunit amino acid transport system ATPase component